jgi:hypothetical protein
MSAGISSFSPGFPLWVQGRQRLVAVQETDGKP